MPRRLAVAVLAALAAGGFAVVHRAGAATAVIVFVSPTGNDANPGTARDRPVRTLPRARDVVRSLNQTMTADLTVSLADGVYRLAQPLTLDARDSGTGGHNVIWTAATGARPVISGGTRVTGWTRFDAAKNIWSAPVPTGLRTRQLYVNGVRAKRASGPLPVTVTKISTGYTTSAPTMDNWRNPKDIEFVYAAGLGGWTEPRCPVFAISPTKITMAQPCWDNTDHRLERTSNQAWNLVGRQKLHVNPTSVENAFELLDTAGEWYLDAPKSTVYYLPRAGENLATANVVAPVLETLISARGTATAPIHHVVFNGLQFSYATWLRPSTPEGFSEVQATWTFTGTGAGNTQGLCTLVPGGTCPYGPWTKTPGNVSVQYAQRIRFTGNGFVHLGGAGLDLGKGVQNVTVQGNVFTDVSANGIQLGEVNNPKASTVDRVSRNRVVDNNLHHLPAEFHSGVAVFVGYADHTTISHNQISDVTYTGVSIGWGGWLDKIMQPGLPNYSNSNAVTNNLIFNHMLLLNDGGGVYVNGAQGSSLTNGLKITGNVIHDEKGQSNSKGVYTDNGAKFVTISGNALYNNPIDWTRRHRNWGGDTMWDPYLIENNLWMKQPPETTGGGVIIRNNTVITSPSQIPASITGNAGLEPAFRSLLTWRPVA